jgi:hypothetical protein
MFVFATLLRHHQRIVRTSVITCDAELHSVSILTSEPSGKKQKTKTKTNDGIFVCCKKKLGFAALSVRHI